MFSVDFKATRTSKPEAAAVTETDAGPEPAVSNDPKPLGQLIPGPRWVSSIEPSRHARERVYITLDGHRSNDDAPYAFVSEDNGLTWRSLNAGLPSGVGSTRVIREDRDNRDLLYLGTEFGFYVSIDRGTSWTRFHGELPTVAIHEIAQHETVDDIVLGTHGRSLWALNVKLLRQLTADVMSRDAMLFEPDEVVYWRSRPSTGGTLRRFVAVNGSSNAQLYYHLGSRARRVALRVMERDGTVLFTATDAATTEGLHRVSWDLRRQPDQAQQGNRRFRRGPRVAPDTYRVELTVDGTTYTSTLDVTGDPEYPDVTLWGTAYDEQLAHDERFEEEDGGEDDED